MAKGKAVCKLKQKAGNRTSGMKAIPGGKFPKSMTKPKPARIGSKKALPKRKGIKRGK
jgi:hypothetical protein